MSTQESDPLTALIKKGCSPAEALDYHMTKERGLSQTEWAEQRGVTDQTVSENIAKAREKLAAAD